MDNNDSNIDKTADNNVLPQTQSYCTLAVTGQVATFQPIFVCHECSAGQNDGTQGAAPLCICQACADHCHDGNDHDVEYIGLGPCYCDCDHMGCCSILKISTEKAKQLGAAVATISRVQESPLPPLTAESSPAPDVETQNNADAQLPHTHEETQLPENSSLVFDTYDIPFLQDISIATELVEQAQELIKHSKETFWLDNYTCEGNRQEFCALERLAWNIFKHHIEEYSTILLPANGTESNCGAEWWVQVKAAKSNDKEGAIDLHYDKDEALAEVFGIGVFPTLSTVTYLTDVISASPTIVLDHTYTQGEDNLIDTMLVSRPRLGKHLVFDGKLLHGAPSHADLKPVEKDSKDVHTPSVRVTFLVNVWKHGKPAKVQPLDKSIRQTLIEMPGNGTIWEEYKMVAKPIPTVSVDKDDDLPESYRHRIELPFVTKGVTWEDQLNMANRVKGEEGSGEEEVDDDDDDGGGLVVITFPPPTTEDTMLVKFGPGLQAYLDYPQKETEVLEYEAGNQESGYV